MVGWMYFLHTLAGKERADGLIGVFALDFIID
jgi:hypothetical protein